MPNLNDIKNPLAKQLYRQADAQLLDLEKHYSSVDYKNTLLDSHEQHSGANLTGKVTHMFAPKMYYQQAEAGANQKINRIKTSIQAVRTAIFEQIKALDTAIENNPQGLDNLLKIMPLAPKGSVIERDSNLPLKYEFSEDILLALRENIPSSSKDLSVAALQKLIDLCDSRTSIHARILLNGLGEGEVSKLSEIQKTGVRHSTVKTGGLINPIEQTKKEGSQNM